MKIDWSSPSTCKQKSGLPRTLSLSPPSGAAPTFPTETPSWASAAPSPETNQWTTSTQFVNMILIVLQVSSWNCILFHFPISVRPRHEHLGHVVGLAEDSSYRSRCTHLGWKWYSVLGDTASRECFNSSVARFSRHFLCKFLWKFSSCLAAQQL